VATRKEHLKGDESWPLKTLKIIAGKISLRRKFLKTYTPYQRETYIGQRPALLAIDFYGLA
jgi:hypothetical protein